MTMFLGNRAEADALIAAGHPISNVVGHPSLLALLTGSLTLHLRLITSLSEVGNIGGVYLALRSDPRIGIGFYGDSCRALIMSGKLGKMLYVGETPQTLANSVETRGLYSKMDQNGTYPWRIARNAESVFTPHACFETDITSDYVVFGLPSAASYGMVWAGLRSVTDHPFIKYTNHGAAFAFVGLRGPSRSEDGGLSSYAVAGAPLSSSLSYAHAAMEVAKQYAKDGVRENPEVLRHTVSGISKLIKNQPKATMSQRFTLPFVVASGPEGSYFGLGDAPLVVSQPVVDEASQMTGVTGGYRTANLRASTFNGNLSVGTTFHGEGSGTRYDRSATYAPVPAILAMCPEFRYYESFEGIPLCNPVRCMTAFARASFFTTSGTTPNVDAPAAPWGTTLRPHTVPTGNANATVMASVLLNPFPLQGTPSTTYALPVLDTSRSYRVIPRTVEGIDIVRAFAGVAPFVFYSPIGGISIKHEDPAAESRSVQQYIADSFGDVFMEDQRAKSLTADSESIISGTTSMNTVAAAAAANVDIPLGAWVYHPLSFYPKMKDFIAEITSAVAAEVS